MFALLAVGASAMYLRMGRHGWFFLDDWDFLTSRSAGNLNDLLRPHNQHWVTVPILVWRALWQVFGARSYLPYEVLSVLLHVGVAALLRVVMRRAGVGAWVATIAAGVFLLFGTGAQNILSAFQIAFTGALVFGLAQLLLADHDGALDHRDWLALGAGTLGLMCSGVAVAMVVTVGVVMFLRRGARIAAFHTAPLFAIYAAWYFAYGRGATKFAGSLGNAVVFLRTDLAATFGALGGVTGAGVGLAILLGVGLVILWTTSDATDRRARLAIPVALLVGATVFFLTAAVGQKSDQSIVVLPAESRYLYVGAALLIPVLAVALDMIVRRSRLLGVVAVAGLVIGIPANLSAASNFATAQARLAGDSRSVLLSIAGMPLSARAPGTLRPDPVGAPSVTLDWLRRAQRANELPAVGKPSAALLARDRLRLSLMELDSTRTGSCARLRAPVVRNLVRGKRLDIGDGAVTVSSLPRAGSTGAVLLGNVLFRSSSREHALESVIGHLTVRIAPVGGHDAELC